MGELSRIGLLTLGTTCFGAFCWGLRWHFRAHGAMPLGMRLVGALSLVAFAWFARDVVDEPLGSAWPLAATLMLAALTMFVAAARASKAARLTVAFAADQPQVLLEHGPYRLVRHPFYSAYLLYWLATALARPGWAPWLVTAAFYGIYWYAGRLEEEKFERSPLAASYAAYRDRTGMFLPFGPLLARLTNL